MALAHAQRTCIHAAQHDDEHSLASPMVWASLSALGAGVWSFAPAGTDPISHP